MLVIDLVGGGIGEVVLSLDREAGVVVAVAVVVQINTTLSVGSSSSSCLARRTGFSGNSEARFANVHATEGWIDRSKAETKLTLRVSHP